MRSRACYLYAASYQTPCTPRLSIDVCRNRHSPVQLSSSWIEAREAKATRRFATWQRQNLLAMFYLLWWSNHECLFVCSTSYISWKTSHFWILLVGSWQVSSSFQSRPQRVNRGLAKERRPSICLGCASLFATQNKGTQIPGQCSFVTKDLRGDSLSVHRGWKNPARNALFLAQFHCGLPLNE